MQLRVGQRLPAGRRDALVLFDEIEDLLAQPDFGFLFGVNQRGGSKMHLHRLLETNARANSRRWRLGICAMCTRKIPLQHCFALSYGRIPPRRCRRSRLFGWSKEASHERRRGTLLPDLEGEDHKLIFYRFLDGFRDAVRAFLAERWSHQQVVADRQDSSIEGRILLTPRI